MDTPVQPLVVHVITGLGDGGAEGAMVRLVTNDHNARHHVVSLADEGVHGPVLKQHGIPVTTLNMRPGFSAIRTLFQLRTLLAQLRPAVVQTWLYHADLFGGIAARLAGIRNIFWSVRNTEFSTAGAYNSAHIIARIAAPFSYVIPKRIIAVAHTAIEAHRNMRYNIQKMVVVHNGYDFSAFYPDSTKRAAFRSELGGGDMAVLLGYVARFNKQKDHRTLFEAIAKVKQCGIPFRLVLVGRNIDAHNDELGSAIREFGLANEVVLLGQRSDIPSVMNGLDIHVMSSAFGEGFPNVLAEAMACGTPCVTTDVGDAKIIVSEYGWVVPHSRPELLARALVQALTEKTQEPNRFASRASQGTGHIQQSFSIGRMIEGFREVWQG